MATVTAQLRDGLKVGDETHREAELREATAGDILDGMADAERLVCTPDGEWRLVQSSGLLSVHVLRRRILRIGSYPGPLTLAEMRSLSSDDLIELQSAADRLDGASLEEALTRSGESGGG